MQNMDTSKAHFARGLSGRYVFIVLTESGMLSLCEVEVGSVYISPAYEFEDLARQEPHQISNLKS